MTQDELKRAVAREAVQQIPLNDLMAALHTKLLVARLAQANAMFAAHAARTATK